jgi:ATP-binding cassette, subfamily C (CFTR/MRP), member 2
LKKCELEEAVENMGAGLESTVAEYGENMSQGQRQLLCLGRALLRQCKLLLLDEATSSIDRVTDALVQRTIRSSFKDVTILTIAHRVDTIIDSDLIMVMDDGKVEELNTPKILLENNDSAFSHIVKEMGADVYKDLYAAACGHQQINSDTNKD